MRGKGISFRVEGWAAWSPECGSESEWRAWAGMPATGVVVVDGAVPGLLRRRVTPLGQKALRAAWGLDGARSAKAVFASRHGEFARTLSILDAIAGEEPISPADFSLSVHHALAGLLSIAGGNRRGHATIAGQRESFCCGLLEAAAGLAEAPDEPVLFVYYDEPLPPPYESFNRRGEETIALALCLGAPAGGGIRLCTAPAQAGAASLTPAHDFLRFALGPEGRLTIPGDRLDWHWEKLDAAA